MAAYYNEIDPSCAQWLRNLIAVGHIAPGEVDERDIRDVHPDDVRGFAQCHWFAGIGGWSRALRLAGYPDERPVWTGSCPCQPFSSAGAGLGFADERHLWPFWHWLIAQRRPAKIFGEQVASKDVEPWIDLVFTDLEATGYACGTNPFPSASVGAPHIRDRTYFMADAAFGAQRTRNRQSGSRIRSEESYRGHGVSVELADAAGTRWRTPRRDDREDGRSAAEPIGLRDACAERAGPTNGFWRAADWLLCRDEKWRPVEPGTFPLVDGLPAGMGKLSTGLRRLVEVAGLNAASLKRAKSYRVGTLRGYGNAINPHQAAEFIKAADEALTA